MVPSKKDGCSNKEIESRAGKRDILFSQMFAVLITKSLQLVLA
jgi:hypothetical protein